MLTTPLQTEFYFSPSQIARARNLDPHFVAAVLEGGLGRPGIILQPHRLKRKTEKKRPRSYRNLRATMVAFDRELARLAVKR